MAWNEIFKKTLKLPLLKSKEAEYGYISEYASLYILVKLRCYNFS